MLIKSNILLDVRLENVKIDFVDNFKYLGLILDKDLTFSLHIIRRISRIAGLFRRLKRIFFHFLLRECCFLHCFKFQSQVSYGIGVWARTYHYLINGIQRLQNLFGFPFLKETYDIHKSYISDCFASL
jgi:hypothetical protein